MTSVRALDSFGAIAQLGIADRPDPKLDRVLDATERCLARHGVRRTTMSDIAREMGVSRPTLYKLVSSVEDALALAVSRQLHRLIDQLEGLLLSGGSAETFVQMAVQTVAYARADSAVQRLLTHEPELIGAVITGGGLGLQVHQVVDLVAPLLEAAMDTGTIRAGDARLTAELIVRLCGTLILAPPDGDAEALIRYGLEPLLIPSSRVKRAKKRR